MVMHIRGEDARFARYSPSASELGEFFSAQGCQKQKYDLSGPIFVSGDLEESRTPIDGMKTRCTNRYTTRPIWLYFLIITNIFRKRKSNCIRYGNLFCRKGRQGKSGCKCRFRRNSG